MAGKLKCFSAGVFLLLAGFAWAQQGADIPPMLETPWPLESPDTTTPTPPSQEKITKAVSGPSKRLKKTQGKKKKNRAYTSLKKKSRKASGKKTKLTQNLKVHRELQRRSEAKTSGHNP